MINKNQTGEKLAIQLQDHKISKHHDTCVILHVYYPDAWEKIASYLLNLGKNFDLIVTIPYGVNLQSEAIREKYHNAQVYRCENRGRDVAPFLAVFSAVSKLGYKYICKIHTKKSLHIKNGVEWQEDMLEKLLGSQKTISQIKRAFQNNSNLGIIGPQGHVVPYDYFWEPNSENVIKLSRLLNISTENIEFLYVAGSMFWFRPDALANLLNLELHSRDFEHEKGQIDGTLAHAIERLFGMIVNHAGYDIAESNLQGIKTPEISFQFNLLIQAFQQREQLFSKQVSEYNNLLSTLNSRLSEKERALNEIYASKAWRLILFLRRIRLWLIPYGSKRENILRRAFQGMRFIQSAGIKFFFRRVLDRFKQINRIRIRRNLSSPIKVSKSAKPNPYIAINEQNIDPTSVSAKIIAFYLPQFHPIPENDAWWGKGFTEWTNVSKAFPNFSGHYQPHLPGELGYYDLRLPEIQKQQIDLAKKYGIYGFCFYYYWFAGKKLLERPLEQYLENSHLDLPFCLCWANENWTRRWDGAEHDILIAQEYTEDQFSSFIKDISKYFSDPRYIRVDGKPILLVYRVNLFPDPQKAVDIWRSECRKMGIGEIYLVAVQSFGITDPRPFGFDAAVEFPPSHLGKAEIGYESIKITNPKFNGRIFDYNIAAQAMMEKIHAGYTVFKTIMTSWDNTARKQNDSHIFINASPTAYQNWLEKAVAYSTKALPEDKRFIFINAWNEWAEGAHLEPDRYQGYAYLQATADAITKIKKISNWTILFISHDANKGGAQDVLINIVSWFKNHTNINIKVLCLKGGDWLSRFTEIVETRVLGEFDSRENENKLLEQIEEFCDGPPSLIYGNTVAAGSIYKQIAKLNAPIVTHFHELETSIRKYGKEWIDDVLTHSSHFIACSKAVQDNLIKRHSVSHENVSTVYASIISRQSEILDNAKKRAIRKKLGLEQDKTLIFGCGIGMPFRKGADLFIKLGKRLLQGGYKDFHLYWIGDFDPAYKDDEYGLWGEHYSKLMDSQVRKYITFLGLKENPRKYLSCGDIFVLPSREDPFPLVALEAADCGLPIVCFDEAGGMPDFVNEDAGFVAPYENLEVMAQKVIELLEQNKLRQRLGKQAREKLLRKFTIESTTPYILSACRKIANKKPAISVIVPNYNHEKYLGVRLDSIFNQTFRDFEVILLDDASLDNSLEILEKYTCHPDVQLVPNKTNSGSPFKQWLRGIDLAAADILWVAESDDTCEPDFLKTLLPSFENPRVKLAYANSHIIDENNNIVGDYIGMDYLSSLSRTKWSSSYLVSAEQEINDGLGVKNTILNISAVLVRRFEISQELRKTLENMRIAGDWYFIVHAIKNGLVHYDARKLSFHRRHSSSVIAQTISNKKKLHNFFKEFYIVQKYIVDHYTLYNEFPKKWERYLKKQWDDFVPNQPFDTIEQYYPLNKMRGIITQKSI